MKIGRLEINFGSGQNQGPPTVKDRASDKVDQFYEVSTKSFSTYKTVVGDTSITYDILEGLYRKTIMRKIIDKMAADATRLGYVAVNCVDINGQENDGAKQIAAEVTQLMTRRVLKAVYRDMMLYGDAFLFKKKGTPEGGSIKVKDVYPINPRYLEPDVKDQKIVGWKYNSAQGKQEPISFEEIIHIPNNPITGQLFGNSIFEPVLQTLNLILNSHLNTAVILDKYALPIVHWKIDSKHPTRKTPVPEIMKFINGMGKMSTGTDFVSDSSVDTDVIGGGQTMPDFSPMMDKLDSYFFATAGIPNSLLGFKADNLSAITRQLQTYYDNVFDMQENVADYLISDLYWPEMKNANVSNLSRIYFSYPKPMVEQESRVSTWAKTMGEAGVIFKKEARAAMGYTGEPPASPEIFPPATGGVAEEGPDIDKKQNQQTPPGVKQK